MLSHVLIAVWLYSEQTRNKNEPCSGTSSAFKHLSHCFVFMLSNAKKANDSDHPELLVETEVPSAPTGLRVSNVTDKSAEVSWSPPDSDGGTPITNYIVQMRVIPRSTFTVVEQTLELKVTLTGLVPDNQYMVQIIAVNAEGQSQPLGTREPICPQKILSE